MFNSIANQASKLLKLTTKENENIKSKTKLLTITSGKGGVGKTTLASNIAFLLAKKKYKIALLDADIGLANLQVVLNMKPKITFFDYLEGKCKLEDTILETSYQNIYLIAGKSGYTNIENNNNFIFSRLVEKIISLNKFDFLIVDTGAGLNEQVKEFLSISDNILAITTTDPSALTDVYSLIKLLSFKKKSLLLCFNHTKNYQIGETITNSLMNLAKNNRLNQDFMVKYIGNVSTDGNILTTGRLRKLFSKEFSQEESVKQLQNVVDRLVEKIY